MDNIKNNIYYIQKIRKDLEFIVEHMRDVSMEELNVNEVLLDSMLFRMIQISENAKGWQMNIKCLTVIFRGAH